MRYSKLALLSTLSGFALLTATSSSPAFAPSVTDLGLLRQQETWQVSNVDAKNAKYCAMATQFDKEISLAFARSPSGAGSLAMSFPGNILDTGMTYQVSMQVDDMQPRRYDVRATSPHSLIVQIGRDEDFYSALGGNGTLRISLPTMNMRFDLAKFSSSYISLVSCTSKLPPHEGPRTAAVPVSDVEKTSLPGSKNAAEPKIASAPVAASPETAAVAPHATAPVIASTPPSSLAAPVSLTAKAAPANVVWKTADVSANPAAENVDLKSKISQLELERTELTNTVNLLKTEKYDALSKLDLKQKQFQMLEASLNAKDRDLASVRSLSNNDSKSLSDMQTELANIKRDRDASLTDMQIKLSEKTMQYDTLQKQFTDGAQARRTAESKAMQAQAELDTLRQRLAAAQEQIASSDLQKSDLTTQVEFQGQQSKTLLQRIQSQLSQATQRLSLMESQLTSVAMQRDDLTSRLDAEINKNKALQASLEVKQRELAYRTQQAITAAATPAPAKVDPSLIGNELLGDTAVTTSASTNPPPLHAAQEDTSFAAPVLKASAEDVKGSSSTPAAESWDTVVIQ